MKVIFPPEEQEFSNLTVFLAGTIDNGNSENWQSEIIKLFEGKNITFFNPRRKDWNPDWEQNINNIEFNKQVNWELDGIEKADLVIIYFLPDSVSPITLLELGVLTKTPEKVLLYCPEGFWKKGNVDIVGKRYGMTIVSSPLEIKSMIDNVLKRI